MAATAGVTASQDVEIPDTETVGTRRRRRQRGGWRDVTNDEDGTIVTKWLSCRGQRADSSRRLTVRVRGELKRHLRPGVPRIRPLLQPGLPRRHDGGLGHSEQTVDDHQQEEESQLERRPHRAPFRQCPVRGTETSSAPSAGEPAGCRTSPAGLGGRRDLERRSRLALDDLGVVRHDREGGQR